MSSHATETEALRLARRALGKAVHPRAIERLFELWPDAVVEVRHFNDRHDGVDFRVTRVRIASPEKPMNAEVYGRAACHENDQFARRHGIDLAFRRALRKVGDHEKHEALVGPLRKLTKEKSEEQIRDCDHKQIVVGAKVDGGNGVVGEVVKIRIEADNEGNPPSVLVDWPDEDGAPEEFTAVLKDYRAEGPSGPYIWVFADVKVIG